MIRKILLSILYSVLLGAAGVAQAATWQVLGGSVYVDPDPLASSPFFSGVLTPGTPGVLTEGSYQDPIFGDEIFSPTTLTSGNPNFAWNYTMSFVTTPYANDPNSTLRPAPSINLTTNTADLSSFRINWYEIMFESTGATAVPITQNLDGSYRLSWQMVGGFSAMGTATMTMDIAPVPLPAAVWLLGSGLIGLIGMGRRSSVRA